MDAQEFPCTMQAGFAKPTAADSETYRLLVEAVTDYAIYLLDPQGRITSWNSGARKIKGYEAQEVLGRHFSLFFPVEDRAAGLPEAALTAARQNGRFESEGWRVRKDGSRFWAVGVLDTVHGPDGEVIGFAKVTRDMTERRAAQEALLESERRFRTLVQGVTDYAIFMLDTEGRVTNWNPGAQRIKGYAADEIVGEHFSRFYTEEDRRAGVPRRVLAEADETGRFEAEGWRIRKDGTRFWANVVIDAIRGKDGELVGFAKVTRDITERYRAQRATEEVREQMAQAQRLEALGQLVAGIAHNYSNLIQIVLSGIRVAERMVPEEGPLLTLLRGIRDAAEQRSGMTRHLLGFARGLPFRPEAIAPAEFLRGALDLLGPSLGRAVKLHLDVEQDIWPIRADPGQFELALLNVALNARDAMPTGGDLQISARNLRLAEPAGLRGEFVAVRMRDTGPGIPRALLERVFEPFFTTKPPGQGTGLGLSQAHGFASAAGGALRVESEPGLGTEVTFLLPAARDNAAVVETAIGLQMEARASEPRHGGRVLIIEPDVAIARLAAEMLAGAEYEVEITTDAQAALLRLNAGERYDLLFADGGSVVSTNGLDLPREIRRRSPKVPVLLAADDPADAASRTGLFVIRKPYSTLELTRAVHTLLGR